jgi:2-iminobutanoate/2-iminopropanoate deaminase
MHPAVPVFTAEAPEPSGTYSQAVIAPPFIFLAGQGPIDPKTQQLVDGDTESQLRLVMRNLASVAVAAGSSLGQAIRFGVFLRRADDVQVVNRVFAELLTNPYPARTTVQSDLPFSVEVDAILYAPQT